MIWNDYYLWTTCYEFFIDLLVFIWKNKHSFCVVYGELTWKIQNIKRWCWIADFVYYCILKLLIVGITYLVFSRSYKWVQRITKLWFDCRLDWGILVHNQQQKKLVVKATTIQVWNLSCAILFSYFLRHSSSLMVNIFSHTSTSQW